MFFMAAETAIYVRISKDKTGELVGVGNQGDECEEMCDRNAWTDRETYTDNDISATKAGPRADYNLLMRDVQAGGIKRIVVFHLSRLWRNRRERAEGIEILRRHGVSVICTKGPTIDLSTAYGRGMAAMLGEVDTMEVEIKSERQQLANAARLKAGEPHPGGQRAFGYLADGLTIHPDESPYVEELFKRWNSRATLGELCRWLNGQDVRTTRGNKWRNSSIKRVLGNPRYAGLRGTLPLLFERDGRPVLNSKGEHRRAEWQEVVGKATWPGIVEEEVWRAAVVKLKDPARASGRPNLGRVHLATGLFRCAVCGAALRCHTTGQQRSFKCLTNGHVNRKAEPVEEFVRDIILERLRQKDSAELLRKRVPGVDVVALRDERDGIRDRLRQFARDEVLGCRTRDEVLAAREGAAERVTEIESLLADAGKVDIVAKFIGGGVDPKAVWDDPSTSLGMKQRLIEALVVVRVGRGRVGRISKRAQDEPPPNVHMDWRKVG